MQPLNDETRAWLDDAMREETLEPGERARLWKAISATVDAGTPLGDDGDVAPKHGLLDRAVRLRHVIGVATIVFAAGVGAGRAMTPSAPSNVPVAQPAPSAIPAPPPTTTVVTPPVASTSVVSTPSATATLSVTPSATLASPGRSAAPSAAASMDEVRMIIKAKRALDEKRPADALAALDEHERSFPHGSLAEERDALRVLALCAGGRASEGAAERATFLRAHPLSAYADRVRAACAP